ncbi:DUF5916 domain-containing protein [Rubrivirga sp. IMCC43871]|uniref:carbohydrate binding family 9 domain-containing protein n=1 Tax=Rubrivirga sp. IMCC43871 TaxID=3391575 RepID=UPI00398FD0BA
MTRSSDITLLIAQAPGTRPFRTVVGMDSGVGGHNASDAPHGAALLATRTPRESPAAPPPAALPPMTSVTRLVVLATALAPTLVSAQPADAPFVVPRLTGPIDLDGRVDEAAWDAVVPLDLVTHWPAFGDAPSVPTEIRLAYDDEYVYVSCRCYAPPEAVFAASFERDINTLGTDYLGLALDTYNDNSTGVGFWTTPTGSRTDGTFANDNGEVDDTWNTFWDAEVAATPEGWFAEMRVPFSSLRFQPDASGRVTMGLSAWRYLGKKNEMDIYPAIEPDWGFWSFNKPSQFQTVVFEGIEARRPVYITPYALGGLGQSFDVDDAAGTVRTDDTVTEVGADVKMSLSDNLTLDLTLNTDFAQVEADNQQVNLTRFSLFFPEKRQFFLERASLFDFDLGGSNRLFYSRRIGLNDGEAVRLLGGGRAVGRVGGWDVGLINLQTARRTPLDGAVLPSENVGVLRLRRQALNSQSTVGGMLTSRLGDDGTTNVAYGLDGDLRLGKDAFAELRWAQTFDDAVDGGGLLDHTRLRASVESRQYTGLGYAAKVERAGRAYRPDLGFELREDFTNGGGILWHGWGPRPGSRLARHQVRVLGETYLRNADGTVETVESSASWAGTFTSAASLTARATVTYDDLRDGFSLSDDAAVPAGEYTFPAASLSYDTPGGRPRRATVFASGGAFYDGWRATVGVAPTWVVSKHLTLSGDYEVNQVGFPDRDQTFTAHVGRLRVRAALDTRWSLASFLQLNSAADAGLANVRLRYNPREGNDLYLVVNWGFHTDALRASTGRPLTDQRAVLAKYTTTFAL